MASVIHRTTYQYLESVNSPDYPTGTWLHNPDVSGLSEVPREFWIVDGEAVREMIAAEKDANCLVQCKAAKCITIDARTVELITEGFTHDSKTFSLSAPAQDNLNGMYTTRAEVWVTYPIVYNTKDDTDKISLADAAAVDTFYQAAYAAKRGHLDSGTALKTQVRAAATVALLDAITDSR